MVQVGAGSFMFGFPLSVSYTQDVPLLYLGMNRVYESYLLLLLYVPHYCGDSIYFIPH